MALINRGSIESLLRPGLDAVFINNDVYPSLYKSIYTTLTSDKAVEYDVEVQGLPMGQIKQDGAPGFQASMQQAYMTTYLHQYYSIAFTITRAAIMDNLYQSEFPRQAESMRASLDSLKNANATYIFNNAFNGNSLVSDGQPLCSTIHPISTGTLANTFSNPVQLNEASLEDGIALIKSWSNQAGLKINTNSIKVLVPQARMFDISRQLNSEFRTGTGNNDINAIKHDKYMPGGYIVNPYITNPNYWFILTDEANGFKHFTREKVDIDFKTDIDTDNLTVRAVERYSFGCSNWRAVFGSTGA